uniref:C-type lectin domain family 2 member E-like n=1 Tax=Nannospalax galili TaxID=1026970 RepID=A0A8C6RP42_NANGA
KKLQGKCLTLASPVTSTKLFCCCLLTTVLTAAVVGLSVALLVRKPEQAIMNHTYYSTCPRKWIGYGNKCYYFSEDTRNWTHCQNSCRALGAELTQFESLEELDFLRRFMGPSDHWIGLQRESSQPAWKWTDNTEYSNTVSIRGVGEHAYLNVNGISSARQHIDRKWICSKPISYSLQCQIPTSF